MAISNRNRKPQERPLGRTRAQTAFLLIFRLAALATARTVCLVLCLPRSHGVCDDSFVVGPVSSLPASAPARLVPAQCFIVAASFFSVSAICLPVVASRFFDAALCPATPGSSLFDHTGYCFVSTPRIAKCPALLAFRRRRPQLFTSRCRHRPSDFAVHFDRVQRPCFCIPSACC